MTKEEFIEGIIWTDLISHKEALMMLLLASKHDLKINNILTKIEDYAWNDYLENKNAKKH